MQPSNAHTAHAPRVERRFARRGFTIVELLVGLAIVAVLIGITMMRIDRERYRVDSQVQALGFAMNAAQREAVLRQHDVRLRFDTARHRVRIHRDADNSGSVEPDERETVLVLEDDVLFGLVGSDGFAWGSEPVTFRAGSEGEPTLTFHRNGSASDFGVVYLSSRNALRAYNRALEVERATGEVRCHTYRTGDWELAC